MTRDDGTTRRDFLKVVAAASLTAAPSRVLGQTAGASRPSTPSGTDLLRPPDSISARFGMSKPIPLQRAANDWTCPGTKVTVAPVPVARHQELPVRVLSEGAAPTFLHLRWRVAQDEAARFIGDAWERSYGDLEWRGIVPNRAMPWYFMAFDGRTVHGHGVKTQPSAFCFWQADRDGFTLTIDLRNGGEATLLNRRELLACTVVLWQGQPGQPIAHAAHEFCAKLCPTPRLPGGPIFGSNDWNYAYGKNTAAGILRDADLIASIAPSGNVRPYVVIDDGYQDSSRFPDMANLASEIRKRELRPGVWIRPLRATPAVQASLLLPKGRFGRAATDAALAFDPTIPEALEQILKSIRIPCAWGYEFIKHDFSTWELFGRWGFAMDTGPALPGWHFADRSRTSGEIVADLYHAIRNAAGEQTAILGCNTVGHIAAGIFESQRIADDTSGHDWERTRRYGVNGLTHRIAQHGTFSHIDPDCVAITKDVRWRETSQWMDVVARSGTSLFFSPEPGSITPEIRAAMAEALVISSEGARGFPTHSTQGTTPGAWTFQHPTSVTRNYDWVGEDGVSAFPV